MLDNAFFVNALNDTSLREVYSVVHFFKKNPEAVTVYKENGFFYALPFLSTRVECKKKYIVDNYLLPFFWMYSEDDGKVVKVGVKIPGFIGKIDFNDIEIRVNGEVVRRINPGDDGFVDDLFDSDDFFIECDGLVFEKYTGWVQCILKTKTLSHVFSIFLSDGRFFDVFAAQANRRNLFLGIYADKFIVNARNEKNCCIHEKKTCKKDSGFLLEVIEDCRIFSRKKTYGLSSPVVIDLKKRYGLTTMYRFYLKSSFGRVSLSYKSLNDMSGAGPVLSKNADILFKIKSYSIFFKLYRRLKPFLKKLKAGGFIRLSIGDKMGHEEAYRKLNEFEDATDALNFDLSSIKVWQISRFFQYNKVLSGVGVFKDVFENKKKNLVTGESEIDSAYRYVSKYGSPLTSKASEVVVFDNLRKRKNRSTDEYHDRDTSSLIKALCLLGRTCTIFEHDHLKRHHMPFSESRKYMDAYKLYAARSSQSSFGFTEPEVDRINSVEKCLSESLGLNYDLKKSFSYWVRRYILEYTFYFHVLKHVEPVWSFVVGPYRPWHHEVARNLGIRSVEIQYAAVVDYHPGYDLVRSSIYCPDYIFSWSSYWKSLLSTTVDSNVLNVGFLNADDFLKKTCTRSTDILFVSQSTIGDQLFAQCLELALAFPSKKIKYRLHPHESKDIFEDKAAGFCNLVVCDSGDRDLNEELESALCVVGVYSTALFEAFDKGCNVVIFDLPGAMHMKKFRKETRMPLISDSSEFQAEWISCNKNFKGKIFFEESKLEGSGDLLLKLLNHGQAVP